jgi:sec-independent protein translocase protein TatA
MLSGISPLSLLLILLIVVLLFGTKKLRNIGSDLGGAIRSFRKASKEEPESGEEQQDENSTLEGRSRHEDD